MTRIPAQQAAEDAQDLSPERIYVLTGGRGGPNARTRLDLVTLVIAIGRPSLLSTTHRRLFPEHLAVLGFCRRPLSVAEISAHLRLPFSATAVLVEDLMLAELVQTRAVAAHALPDPALLEEVLRGLQRL